MTQTQITGQLCGACPANSESLLGSVNRSTCICAAGFYGAHVRVCTNTCMCVCTHIYVYKRSFVCVSPSPCWGLSNALPAYVLLSLSLSQILFLQLSLSPSPPPPPSTSLSFSLSQTRIHTLQEVWPKSWAKIAQKSAKSARPTPRLVTWLLLVCDMTHSYVWHDSLVCATQHIRMFNMTPSYVWRLNHMCDLTP